MSENKKGINIYTVIIVTLVFMILIAFSGFMYLFIKYINNKNVDITQTVPIQVKNKESRSELENFKENDYNTFTKEEILSLDKIIWDTFKTQMNIKEDMVISIQDYTNNILTRENFQIKVSTVTKSMEEFVTNNSLYEIYPNNYTKAIDDYCFKVYEFFTTLNTQLEIEGFEYFVTVEEIIKQLNDLELEVFSQRVKFLTENGLSVEEIAELGL